MAQGTYWTERTFFRGIYTPITELLANGSHVIEVWGCAADGWQAYLVRDGIGLPIGPVFHRDFGDTLRSLKAACERAYGVVPKKGRDWN